MATCLQANHFTSPTPLAHGFSDILQKQKLEKIPENVFFRKARSKSEPYHIVETKQKRKKKYIYIYTHTDTPTPNVLPLLKILLYITLLVEIIRVELFF